MAKTNLFIMASFLIMLNASYGPIYFRQAEWPMKYSQQRLNEVLLAATPEQLAELRAISEVFDISPDESAPRG